MDQQQWEQEVRNALRDWGYSPDKVEIEAEGFGQDFFEYQDDPRQYARVVIDSLDPATRDACLA